MPVNSASTFSQLMSSLFSQHASAMETETVTCDSRSAVLAEQLGDARMGTAGGQRMSHRRSEARPKLGEYYCRVSWVY
eukprot:2880567-Rhodomonas_salina.2